MINTQPVKRLLPLMLALALALPLLAACGSDKRAKSSSRGGVRNATSAAKRLLDIALAEVRAKGESNPSLIAFTNDGRSGSVLVGIHRSCSAGATGDSCLPTINYRSSVDPVRGKATAFLPQSPPVVINRSTVGYTNPATATAIERTLRHIRATAVSYGLDSQITLVLKGRYRTFTPAPRYLGIKVTGGAGGDELEWRESTAEVMRCPSEPVLGATGFKGGDREGRGFTRIGCSNGYSLYSHFYALEDKLALARGIFAAAERDGARITSFGIYGSRDPAVSLTIETTRPAIYLKHDLKGVLAFFDQKNWPQSASFLNVVDRRGNWIASKGGNASEGFYGTVRWLAGCSPIKNNRGPSPHPHKIPPCPVS
jgi:hypothetical protein